ncbi:MAG: hypothetical protein L6265_10360, partial [Thermoplasmatales archaeon]|nr:hypothetical protein [Thermoplasmatales archaeon]
MDYDITTDNTYLSYDGETIIKKLHDNFKRSGYDRVVGLFPDGYWDAEKDGYDGLSDTSFTLFGYNWWYSSVIAKDTDPGATAHEMGHTHGLPAKGSGGEEYNLPEFKNAIMMKANPAQGWWVSKGASGCIYGPFTEGFGYYCFMGLSKTDSFNKWWICNEDYDVLYKALVTTEGSTKGALKSIMNKTLIGMGSMVNNSIGYDVNFDILEVFDGVTKYHEIESDYCVLALDSSGNEISRVNITSFWFNDTLRFYFEIPYSNNIDSIELYHNSIKITDVSGNASGITISLTDVNVTDSNPDYRKINISWATNATDVNLDYSVNNGETWDPIASGLSGNGYVWNASIWKLQNNISIRATVMDGWMPVHSSMNISLDIVNRPPIVGIISPKNDVLIAKDVTILFEGFAIDPEDGFLDGNQTRWYSSLDGFLGYGGYLSLDNLSNGDHIITFTVTESNGLFSNATLSVRVGQDYLSPNVIPSEEIKVVTSGSFFNITFEAEDDYGILLSYAIFGNETYYLYDTLVNNTFVLRMTAPSEPGEYKINVFFEDHAGNTEDQDVVLLVTNPASSDDFNFVIVTPREGDRYNPNENITFRCEIFNMDGDDARAEWYSYKDGYLGEGFQILKNLSNGQHNITVQIYVNNVIIASRCVGVLV